MWGINQDHCYCSGALGGRYQQLDKDVRVQEAASDWGGDRECCCCDKRLEEASQEEAPLTRSGREGSRRKGG